MILHNTIEEATERALNMADLYAAPVLVMRGERYGREGFAVGFRTLPEVRSFGQHVRTCHRSGLIEEFDSTHDFEIRVGLKTCLCQ